MRHFFLALITGLFVVGCTSEKASEVEVDEKQTKPEKQPQPEKPIHQENPEQPKKTLNGLGPMVAPSIDAPVIGQSPDGEMLPGLVLPQAMGAKNQDKQPPVGKEGLVKMAKKAIERGSIMEAMAILDVLVLTHPSDPMVLEMRGDALLGQGNKEDAMADLDRCCSLGRSSCCR